QRSARLPKRSLCQALVERDGRCAAFGAEKPQGKVSHPAVCALCPALSLGGPGAVGLFLFGTIDPKGGLGVGSDSSREGLGRNDFALGPGVGPRSCTLPRSNT